jgi:hypothetical protein
VGRVTDANVCHFRITQGRLGLSRDDLTGIGIWKGLRYTNCACVEQIEFIGKINAHECTFFI